MPGQNGSHQSGAEVTAETLSADWLLATLNFFLVASTFLLWRANNRSATIGGQAELSQTRENPADPSVGSFAKPS
jgi:hypothetical protein